MDSGNSSSMQSSSGGDDQEYDSRSLMFHHQHQHHTNNNIPPLPQSCSSHQQLQQPPPSDLPISILQPDLFTSWPGANTNYFSFTAPPPPSTSTSTRTLPSAPPPPPKAPGPSKNPKKRTRASRRAPTTVLTTDTTNFRAMVQEFTGIPDPPFSASASSRRLDLFTTAGSSMRLEAAATPPLRPAAQRLPSASLLMHQDTLADPTSLAFERLIHHQQPLLFPPPPPSNVNPSAAFGMSMAGLDANSTGVRLGFGSPSSSQPQNNDNYVMSCGTLTSSSAATDLAPPHGNADYRNQ